MVYLLKSVFSVLMMYLWWMLMSRGAVLATYPSDMTLALALVLLVVGSGLLILALRLTWKEEIQTCASWLSRLS